MQLYRAGVLGASLLLGLNALACKSRGADDTSNYFFTTHEEPYYATSISDIVENEKDYI